MDNDTGNKKIKMLMKDARALALVLPTPKFYAYVKVLYVEMPCVPI